MNIRSKMEQNCLFQALLPVLWRVVFVWGFIFGFWVFLVATRDNK